MILDGVCHQVGFERVEVSEQMMKFLGAMAVLVALSACAPLIPLTKAEMTPVYAGQAPGNLNIAVVDLRSFILSGDKEEWFEGIVYGPYFIPFSVKRPGPKTGQPFALYLSSMLAEAMVAAGSNVTIVPIAKGTDTDEVIRQSSIENNAPSIIFLMHTSRYVIGGYSGEYNHRFDVLVVNQNGETLLNKTFSRFDEKIPAFDKHDLFEFYTMVYKKVLDEILNDRDITAALSEAAIR